MAEDVVIAQLMEIVARTQLTYPVLAALTRIGNSTARHVLVTGRLPTRHAPGESLRTFVLRNRDAATRADLRCNP